MKRFFLVLPVLMLSLVTLVNIKTIAGTNGMSPDSAQLPVITFQVDLSQWSAKGRFNPATDSLDMPGTFNSFAGSTTFAPVAGEPLVYETALTLDSLETVQFRFRINRDSARTESPNGGPFRMLRIPGKSLTMRYMYNDFDTTTVPVTFKCRMAYQVKKDRFNPATDYLDIAGTMNNGGAYDLLYPRTNDSIYSLTMNISRDAITAQVLIGFKFRINGSWSTSEFPNGGMNRTFQVADTVGGHVNLVDVWYNDQDPLVEAAPFAWNVIIQGVIIADTALAGAYTYEDVNGDSEGVSHYQWYHSDDTTGTNIAPITGATMITYVPSDTVVGKYLIFEVIPVATKGTLLTGTPVRVYSATRVGGVGINEHSGLSVRMYPNPVEDLLNFDLGKRIERIEVYSIVGQNVASMDVRGLDIASMHTNNLSPGIYLVKFLNGEKYSFSKFIRR